MPDNEVLTRRIGQRIEEAFLEVLRDDEGEETIIAFWLRFGVGKPLVLGCAGDGGIFSHKGVPNVGPVADVGHFLQIPIPLLTGAVLQSAEPGLERLTLRTSQGAVLLQNDCDCLEIEIAGESY